MRLLTRTFTPELVHEAVEETGAWEERTKALPSTLMVYFTLVMWLFTGQGYGGVLRELLENIPRRPGEKWTRPARTGSVTKARARLGAAPLRLLFGSRTSPSVERRAVLRDHRASRRGRPSWRRCW
ncbi:transposase domain-containing protein [Streptomyces sp. NPDC006365]|uniref:transposase domain-containing protein n=1 Tax=Streptomyces sp. NPDC006365 TaxID=3364744 RepID=UPI0036A19085